MGPQGYVLGPREGEHLVLRGGDLFIKVDPIGGSHSLVMGTHRSCLAQVFQSTGIWKWTRLSTFSKVAEFCFKS